VSIGIGKGKKDAMENTFENAFGQPTIRGCGLADI
jgi:hypothetical protein